MWFAACRFVDVTNRGGGGWITGTLMWHLCRFVTNRGEGVDYRNTYVAFMWIGNNRGGGMDYRNTYVTFMWVCY